MTKSNQPTSLDELLTLFKGALTRPMNGAHKRGPELAAYVFEQSAGGAELRACKKFTYCGVDYNPGDPFAFERADHDQVIAGGAYVLPQEDYEASERYAAALNLDEKTVRPLTARLAALRAELSEVEQKAAELRAERDQGEHDLRRALVSLLGESAMAGS